MADSLRLHLTAYHFDRNYYEHRIALKVPKNSDPNMSCGCWENCFQTVEKMSGFGLWRAEIGCMVCIGHTETNVRARHKKVTTKNRKNRKW